MAGMCGMVQISTKQFQITICLSEIMVCVTFSQCECIRYTNKNEPTINELGVIVLRKETLLVWGYLGKVVYRLLRRRDMS